MHFSTQSFLRPWYRMLGLKREAPALWHRARLREELRECREAPTLILKLSEYSDVVFTISRADYDGFQIGKVPHFLTVRNFSVYAYMLSKFTMRWSFYRTLAYLCKVPHWRRVGEVVNPGRDVNLELVANRHGIDLENFKSVGRRLRRWWPLLP